MKKILLYIFTLSICVIFASCNKDKSGWVTFESEGIFVYDYDQTINVKFTHDNMASLGVFDYPDGWEVSISLSSSTLTATSPADASSGDDQGEVILSGYDDDGDLVLVYLVLAKTDFIALDDPDNYRQSNCMILTEPNKIYTFNPNRRGEELTDQATKAVSCEIIWRSPNMPVGYPTIRDDGSMSVYTISDIYDCDDDDDTNDIVEGNAVIAAYDSSGDILWSWHFWVTESDPTENAVTLNGIDFLPRNLGAATNSIDSEDDILTSYGLYYQWGRRDPFIYPYTYSAMDSYDMPIYDNDGVYVTHDLVDVSSSIGTLYYARQNPMTFIMGEDWKYTPDETLWGSNDKKSIYDPSPRGWRVPSASDLATLTWDGTDVASLTDDTYRYGTSLSGDLFMALGRKTYLDGTTQNASGDGTFIEGAGFYWSRDAIAGSTDAKSLYFYHDQSGTINDASDDVVTMNNNYSIERGNGMQIRCVRDL